MAGGQATAVDDWKDVAADDWKDVSPAAPAKEKPWIGQPRPENEGMLSRIFHTPAYGVQDIGTGIQHLMQPGKRMQGAHEVISGAGQASLPLLLPAAVAAPAATALGMAGGAIGSGIGKTGAEMLGASPEAANLAGDVGGLAGGIGGTKLGPKAIGSAMEHVPQGFNLAHPDVRSGVGKMAAGAALTEAVPGPMKWPVRGVTMIPGIKQTYRGLIKPDAYAQEAVAEIPTIKNAPANAPPAVFGDPEGFAKLPQSVQDAILRGGSHGPSAPTPTAPMAPRSMESYGITPTESAPTPAINTPNLSGALSSLKQKVGIPEGQHLGEVPGAHYPERWAGSDSPTIRSTMAKTKFVKVNPEELGVHGGVEGTPIKGPLNTPEKIRIATDLANELKKNAKGGK